LDAYLLHFLNGLYNPDRFLKPVRIKKKPLRNSEGLAILVVV